MTSLETKLNQILNEKETKIIPENIKKDVQIFDVVGTLEAGSSGLTKKDVNFYDYDGTLLYSYTKQEFLLLNSLPQNPSHTGLIAEGWNWDLSDAQKCVVNYGKLDIGQMYTTSSGLSEFDIELTPYTGLEVALGMNGEKNWGDGTVNEETRHEYADYGTYTITCNGTELIQQSQFLNIFDNDMDYIVKHIRLSSNISLINCAFQEARAVESIILPTHLTEIPYQSIIGMHSLKAIVIPNSVEILGEGALSEARNLSIISLPNSITEIGQSCFVALPSLLGNLFIPDSVKTIDASILTEANIESLIIGNNIYSIPSSCVMMCSRLQKIKFAGDIQSIDNYSFNGLMSLKVIDFSNNTIIPQLLGEGHFMDGYGAFQIVVPDYLYDTWKADWSNFENNIISASDYNGE